MQHQRQEVCSATGKLYAAQCRAEVCLQGRERFGSIISSMPGMYGQGAGLTLPGVKQRGLVCQKCGLSGGLRRHLLDAGKTFISDFIQR